MFNLHKSISKALLISASALMMLSLAPTSISTANAKQRVNRPRINRIARRIAKKDYHHGYEKFSRSDYSKKNGLYNWRIRHQFIRDTAKLDKKYHTHSSAAFTKFTPNYFEAVEDSWKHPYSGPRTWGRKESKEMVIAFRHGYHLNHHYIIPKKYRHSSAFAQANIAGISYREYQTKGQYWARANRLNYYYRAGGHENSDDLTYAKYSYVYNIGATIRRRYHKTSRRKAAVRRAIKKHHLNKFYRTQLRESAFLKI